MIDEWTEVVPVEKETTGVAFHYNRPNAQAPQALLLAVAPQLRGSWRWDDLVAIVTETLERAKMRAVEPDMVMQTEYFQAPAGDPDRVLQRAGLPLDVPRGQRW